MLYKKKMKKQKKQKTKRKYQPRHTCRWCGAVRYENRMKKLQCALGEFWVCENGDICAATAAQYKPIKKNKKHETIIW